MVTSILITQLAAAILGCTSLAAIIGRLLVRPRIWRPPPTDVLMLVAHQDDCVVLAGEYAIRALDAGRRVRIVYLTCGAKSPDSLRATIRAKEALSAWTGAGVPGHNLYFLGYRQSDICGPLAMSSAESQNATKFIAQLIDEVAPGTAVFLPAAGENHVDHREIRRIGLQAIAMSERDDLLIMEAPEYNNYFSFIRSPRKALQYLAKSLPIVSRMAKLHWKSQFPGFVEGGPSYRFSDSMELRPRKIDMLRPFASENADLLVRYFGWESQFRPISPLSNTAERCSGRGYIQSDDRWLGLSIVGVWSSLYFFAFGTCWSLAQNIAEYVPTPLALAINGLIASATVLAGLRGQKAVETRGLYFSFSLGAWIELLIWIAR